MAKNLRAGLRQDKKLLICDVNLDALNRFKGETEGQGRVEVVSNGYEAAKAAVWKQPLMDLENQADCSGRMWSSPCFRGLKLSSRSI
jgi:hypothetical protein